MHLTLDTNVLVSAYFWEGNERALLWDCVLGDHILVTSPHILRELEGVLTESFDVPSEDARRYLGILERVGTIVEPDERLGALPGNPADDRVISAAHEAGAGALVTGDRDLLELGTHRGLPIVTAAEIADR